MKRGFAWLMTVRNQPADHSDQEVYRTAMACVLDLADVLQLIIDRFNDGSSPQQELVRCSQLTGSPILAHLGHQLDPQGAQLLRQGGGDVPLVAKQLARQHGDEARHRAPIIDIAPGQAPREQFPLVVDHQMQLEPKEPAGGGFAPCRLAGKDAMLRDAWVLTDTEFGGIDETDAGTRALHRVQVGAQRDEHLRDPMHKPRVADESGKLTAPLGADLALIKILEGAIDERG